MSRLLAKIERLEKEKLDLARQRDNAKDKLKERTQQYYDVAAEFEEERGKNKKLTAQLNKDFENSSIPSSKQKAGKKKIPNSREKTGKKPGGQPGHKGHARKQHVPDITYEIPAPAEYTDNPDYYDTGKIIRRQKISVILNAQIIEYTTKEYRNRKTGARELTNGEIEISDGMINGLCAEFSAKTGQEKNGIIKKLMSSPVMNVDFTNASVNGKSAQVLVLASPSADAALYIGREKKGHKGVEGTPLENYAGTVVHDHDTTFYKYGTGHQECTQHDIRYLIGSIQNEAELEWNKQMLGLMRKMLHYRNSLSENESLSPSTVSEFEAEYDRILETAEKEYADDPPNDYYREGYNLFLRLRKYKENELLFLHDKRVPANNSLCERLARVYKRKQKQAVTLRSLKNLCYICDSLSIVYLLRSNEENVYQKITEIYGRERSPKSEGKTDATA